MRKGKILSIIIFLLNLGCVKAQSAKNYSFVKEKENVIHNAETLKSFFSILQKDEKNKINVLHIGDSHIQADMITDVLRGKFQQKFGNAGRGMIVPYKVAGTNSPADISSSSQIKWEGKRNSKPLLPQVNGIGGITIESADSTAAFTFKLVEKYAFTRMTIFIENDGKSYALKAKDLTNGEFINLMDFISKKDPNVIEVQFKKPVTEVEIISEKTSPEQTHITILGINTENEEKGLIYHSIGVNGAEYFHYDTSKYFNEQTPFLHPDIIIISMGTNEAYRKNTDFNETIILEQIDSFIKNLKKYNPETPILITTPPYAYLNNKQNPRLTVIHDLLVSYCQQHNIAYWDLQQITGNAYNWKINNLFSKDLVHFNKKGYQLQGDLLYEALNTAYSEYIND